ncbi:Qat anti-phage system QueC-like protein QatC [Labilibaculum manganireducens]|uniref:Qat anti-phage system QueC-like protein QatC n=1 Tax=Labilibaculum manganireducens TaxID=1940525 RepID=UPI001C55EB3B|nr:Qat anti-phage system QueC-like protein QatC [Labilibaculum manganireducens]
MNNSDDFSVDRSVFEVNLTDKKSYHWTFYQYYRRLFQFPKFFSNEALDLFYISLMVYYADRKVLRSGTYDAWTREMKIYMPVLELDKWNENKFLLEKMISFLSGDIWQFEFRKRELNEKEKKVSAGIIKTKKKYSPDAFCMLSGGLDSFIGAIDLLSENKNIAFVGHYGGGKGVLEYQNNVKSELTKEFDLDEKQFFNFFAAPIKGIEDSTRTRSFMFFAHAIILASAVDKDIKLYIPENGLISLNIPLTNTRLGSSSTRTTHPYYMNLLQLLLTNMDIKIELVNPYQFFTKGEMIQNCKVPAFIKRNITKTMSCSHPDLGRYQRENAPSHCGTCLPCIIRRASIEKAYGADSSVYRDKDFNIGKAVTELNSYKIGILDYKTTNSNTSFKIQESGPIASNQDNFKKLYRRGMNELTTLLDKYNG